VAVTQLYFTYNNFTFIQINYTSLLVLTQPLTNITLKDIYMAIPAINLESLTSYGGKPKDFYLLEFFRLYEKYWDDMIKSTSDRQVDIATGLLIGSCPHKPTRERIWTSYIAMRDDPIKGSISASVYASGDLWDYLSVTLEFTEDAYAGV